MALCVPPSPSRQPRFLYALVWLPLAVGCADGDAAANGDETPDPGLVTGAVCENPAVPAAPVRLLTRTQFNNTVRDLLGDSSSPAQNFPPESQVLGFESNAEAHQATPLLVESLMQAAEGIAARAVAGGASALARCEGAIVDSACAQRFISTVGQRAFRRPLTGNETKLFDNLLESTAAAEGYDRGVELALQAILQSPQFLYRIESPISEAPGSTMPATTVPLGGYQMASRLSYFLWGSMPDEALFEAAANDELRTPAQLKGQAERLLADPRARAMVSDFHRQWLGLDRLNSVVREVAPGMEATGLGPSLAGALMAFAAYTYWDGGGTVQSLFTSSSHFVDATLAPILGSTASADQPYTRVEEATPRAGLLTQPALMALLAHENQTSPILRGAFIREHLMCQPVPAPPPTVDSTPPKPAMTGTTRQRFASHASDSTCSSCHSLFDDLGFALENYDQLGRYRSDENGLAIDTVGEIRATRDPALAGPFSNALELAHKLAQSPQVSDCLTTQWYRYTMGRAETEADACSLRTVQQAVVDAQGDLQTLLLALVQTDAFRLRAPLLEETP